MRDVVDATKRGLTKEKIEKQLSRQSGTTTPLMKVGDVSHSGNKVSFDANPIKEQLENVTSILYVTCSLTDHRKSTLVSILYSHMHIMGIID